MKLFKINETLTELSKCYVLLRVTCFLSPPLLISCLRNPIDAGFPPASILLRTARLRYTLQRRPQLEVRSRRIRVVASREYREERVMSAVRWKTGERDLVPMVTSLLLTPRRSPARSLARFLLAHTFQFLPVLCSLSETLTRYTVQLRY